MPALGTSSRVMMQVTTLTSGRSHRLFHPSLILTNVIQSAEIFAANLFQRTFAEDPHSQLAWERFRRGILEYGGSSNEMVILEEFLGGSPADPQALLAVLGISDVTV